MEVIKSLEKLNFDSLFAAFNAAFVDYEIQIGKEELKAMLMRRGFVPELSFGAFENDKLVSFTFNGIGNFNGCKTAYDTGTGTIKEYRGKGLATRIFEYSIPFLKQESISQYLLEVLQHNSKAVSVYKKLGFEVSREFNYFSQSMKEVVVENHLEGYSIKEISMPSKELMASFWNFQPSWQNDFQAIERRIEGFVFIGALENQQLVGYGIFEPVSGDITQIAVNAKYRRKGIASALLRKMSQLNKHDSMKLINTDISCDSIIKFLESKNIQQQGKQYEMVKQL